MRKALHDKGWAEKQAAGFTKWLNYTLVGAEQLRRADGDANEGDDGVDGVVGEGARGVGAVSSSPLKAMVAMVSFALAPSRVCSVVRRWGVRRPRAGRNPWVFDMYAKAQQVIIVTCVGGVFV